MFNYQARWDRDLPQNKQGQKLGPSIAAICIINDGKIIPQSFSWKNRTFNIKKVNFQKLLNP